MSDTTPWGKFYCHDCEVIFCDRRQRQTTIAIFPSKEWAHKVTTRLNQLIDAQ